MSRVCTEETELEYQDGNFVKIDKGIALMIPLYQLQNDSEYYPKPREFDPARFSNGTKQFSDDGIFMTFGSGPRICIGMKLALLQAKSAIYEIVSSFKLSISRKTEKELVIDPAEFMNVKRGGLWINFKSLELKQ